MKKIKFTGKLSLNKETVTKLNDEQMVQVIGGSASRQCVTNFGCPAPTHDCPTKIVFEC